jgi:hypothetical protein
LNILALDLGTATGYAYNRGDEFFCGTWQLATAKEIRQCGKDRLNRRKDPRIEKLCETLTELGKFDLVVFEDVQFSSYTAQTQLWSSLRSAVWLCASAPHFDCVPVGTLKKFATGNGAATKENMMMALFSPAIDMGLNLGKLDDNGVDAVWIWLWAKQKLGRMKL